MEAGDPLPDDPDRGGIRQRGAERRHLAGGAPRLHPVEQRALLRRSRGDPAARIRRDSGNDVAAGVAGGRERLPAPPRPARPRRHAAGRVRRRPTVPWRCGSSRSWPTGSRGRRAPPGPPRGCGAGSAELGPRRVEAVGVHERAQRDHARPQRLGVRGQRVAVVRELQRAEAEHDGGRRTRGRRGSRRRPESSGAGRAPPRSRPGIPASARARTASVCSSFQT